MEIVRRLFADSSIGCPRRRTRTSLPRTFLITGVALLGAVACTGGQTGEITRLSPCEQPVGWIAFDADPAGTGPNGERRQSAVELLPSLPTCSAMLIYGDGTQTPVTAQLDVDGVRQAAPSTQELGGPDFCPVQLRLPVRMELSTEDGAFAEVFSGDLTLTESAGQGNFMGEVDRTALQGNLLPPEDMTPTGPLAWSRVVARVDFYIPSPTNADAPTCTGSLALEDDDERTDETGIGSW